MRAQQRGRISYLDPSLDATQDTVGLLGCMCTLLAHVESFINQHLQILVLRSALKPFSTQRMCLGLLQPICRTLQLALLNFMRLA